MKRILITGASRGIGRAIAEKLATQETMLLLHGRDSAALAETQSAIEQRGARAEIVACDLSDPNAVKEMADRIAGEPLDILVNNAGVAVVKPLADVSLGDWQRAMAVNVTAPFLLTQKLASAIPRGGSIVNILSVAARTGFPGWSSYSTTKFALEGFSQSIREELRARGIRVINIYPAATATEIWKGVEGEWPLEKMISPADVADAVGFALERPPGLLIENISLGSVSGNL